MLILGLKGLILYRAFSYDVTAAILVYQKQ